MKPMEGFTEDSRDCWWPGPLGTSPNSAGGQNEIRYAYFGDKQRLAVNDGSSVKVYDTGEHQVSSVQQKQDGSNRKLVFTSQRGEVDLATLKTVSV